MARPQELLRREVGPEPDQREGARALVQTPRGAELREDRPAARVDVDVVGRERSYDNVRGVQHGQGLADAAAVERDRVGPEPAAPPERPARRVRGQPRAVVVGREA